LPGTIVTSRLFHGTLVFARVVFRRPNKPDYGMSPDDVQTAVSYATLAVVPIQRYASQYGPNSIDVSPTVIDFTADLSTDCFTVEEFEGWVDRIGQTARGSGISNPCVVILHDRSLATTPLFFNQNDSYHGHTHSGFPYCYSLVFGENLSVADNNHTNNGVQNDKVYAHNLSHEIAEMLVDPFGGNPEVCDPCAGNCSNSQFVLFDHNGDFMGGTTDTASATGFGFFLNAIVRANVPRLPTGDGCLVNMADNQTACIYAPPSGWGGPGRLTTVSNPVAVAGHFSSGDQRHLVVVGTAEGKIHEVYWHPAQIGIEGEDDLPVSFNPSTVASVGSIYNVDQGRHIVLVGTTAGKVHEIYWKPETVGIEGDDDLPVSFAADSIVGVSGLYDPNEKRHIVFVGTTAGTVREIYWKADTVGIEGQDDLPVSFTSGSIVGVTGFYNSDQERYVVVVATNQGKLHEIFWKSTTVGVEGHDDLPTYFQPGSIVAVSGFYDPNRKRYVVAVGTNDGAVHQVYWKDDTVGIEAQTTVVNFGESNIVGLAAFYSVSDNVNHIVTALANGQLMESWVTPDV
jgi:hypothetical protein